MNEYKIHLLKNQIFGGRQETCFFWAGGRASSFGLFFFFLSTPNTSQKWSSQAEVQHYGKVKKFTDDEVKLTNH